MPCPSPDSTLHCDPAHSRGASVESGPSVSATLDRIPSGGTCGPTPYAQRIPHRLPAQQQTSASGQQQQQQHAGHHQHPSTSTPRHSAESAAHAPAPSRTTAAMHDVRSVMPVENSLGGMHLDSTSQRGSGSGSSFNSSGPNRSIMAESSSGLPRSGSARITPKVRGTSAAPYVRSKTQPGVPGGGFVSSSSSSDDCEEATKQLLKGMSSGLQGRMNNHDRQQTYGSRTNTQSRMGLASSESPTPRISRVRWGYYGGW